MAERGIEIREYCQAYCARKTPKTGGRAVVPLLLRLAHGDLLFGFYCMSYNQGRTSSLVLRKVCAYGSLNEIHRALEQGLDDGEALESARVVSDRIAAWEAFEGVPAASVALVRALEKESSGFQRETGGLRHLKGRIEQDIRNYNLAHYGRRILVPMVFEMGPGRRGVRVLQRGR